MLIEAPTRLRAAASDLASGQFPDGASPSLTWFIADSGAGPLGLGVSCGAAAPPHAAAAALLLADAEPVLAALDIAQGEPLAWSWVAQPHAPAPGPSSGLVLRSRTDPATCVRLPWAWWRARQSRAHAVADWAEAFEWPEVPATLRAGRLRLSAHVAEQPFRPDGQRIKQMKNATVVIKYGGHAMDKPELSSAFAADLAQLTEQANKMRDRIQALEAILDAEHPNWRDR